MLKSIVMASMVCYTTQAVDLRTYAALRSNNAALAHGMVSNGSSSSNSRGKKVIKKAPIVKDIVT